MIQPVLNGVPNRYKYMLKAVQAEVAAKMLFSAFHIDTSPSVQKVVGDVLKAIKNQP